MERILISVIYHAGFTSIFGFTQSQGFVSSSNNQQLPNVILILIDDLGWADLGCYKNTFNETPNIDRLAKEGIRFTSAYAAAPVCSPSRASLLTGQYPARLGITDYLRPDAKDHLDTALVSLAEMFQHEGYRTGIVGKWHLSGYVNEGAPEETLPEKHGFEEVMISENRGIGAGSYFYPYHFNREINKKLSDGHEYLVDRQNIEALNFIERNKKHSFFLYLSHYAVHTYLHGKPDFVEYFRKKEDAQTSPPHQQNQENDPFKKWPSDFQAPKNNPHLAAQLLSIDQGIGLIIAKLKELGIDKNTLVIFTSDNGGETNVTSNEPLHAGKSTLYEGGIRIPLIIWNPYLFKSGEIVNDPVVNYDFYPTFMELLGSQPIHQKIDGVSLVKFLKHSNVFLQKRSLYWHYPLEKQHFLGGRSSGCIIKGDWKLIVFFDTGEKELYNIKKDIGEKKNLSVKYSYKAQKLLKELSMWRQNVQD